MNVLEKIEQNKLGVFDVYTHLDGSALPSRYNEEDEKEIIRLAKLGAAIDLGINTICDWQEYNGEDTCETCPAQHACKLRKENRND